MLHSTQTAATFVALLAADSTPTATCHSNLAAHRRLQPATDSFAATSSTDDESFLPDDDEWYLPEGGSPVDTIKFLFAAGDSEDWGAVPSNETAESDSPILYSLPTRVDETQEGNEIVSVSAGNVHSVALTNEGLIMTAGSLDDEVLGMGRAIGGNATTPFEPITEVYFLSNITTSHDEAPTTPPKFTQVHASQYFTLALDEDGNVWATGSNTHGNLCLNDTEDRDRFYMVDPRFYNAVDEEQRKITSIALGERHTLLLRQDGKAFGCGWNMYSQLGTGVAGDDVLAPTEIVIDVPDDDFNNTEIGTNGATRTGYEVVTQVAAGRGSSYFLTRMGRIYSVGTNFNGQLCLGHREDRSLPTLLTTVADGLAYTNFSDVTIAGNTEDTSVTSIASGKSSLYILFSNGLVWACGDNAQGQLGDSGTLSDDSTDVPVQVQGVSNVIKVFSGPLSFSSFFVQRNGIVYAVGYNGSGQLAVGDELNRNTPTVVACSDEGDEIAWHGGIVVSSGNDHSLFVGAKNTFSCPDYGASLSPTFSAIPSVAPTLSSQPTQSNMPSTETASPTTSPFVNETDATLSPTPRPTDGGDRNVPNPGNAVEKYSTANAVASLVVVVTLGFILQ